MDEKEVEVEYNEDCGCRRCSTWATITKFECGCVDVDIHNDTDPCDECTDFSGMNNTCSEH